MGKWERRLFGIVALGGSYTGLALGLALVSSEGYWLAKVLAVPFLCLYAWGIWCGLRMIEVGIDACRMNRTFWLMQAPVFMTPWLGYIFTSGVMGWFALGSGWTWGAYFNFGSKFEYSVLQGKPWMFGVNLLGLAAWWWLGRRMRQAQATAVEPVAAQPLEQVEPA